ncbi:MAG: hypothetical protein QOE90_53 [Thermoplasmata archaeon]|jgi:hypothetical protein|nr:hypothetical protein [Thermoplasmata archaeon]
MISAVLAQLANQSPAESSALPASPGGFPEALLLAAILAVVVGAFVVLTFGVALRGEGVYRNGRLRP